MKVSQIYALQGPPKRGKTTTIKILFEMLKDKYPNAEIHRFRGKVDIRIIMFNISGKKVGIVSFGDVATKLDNYLRSFEDADCDVIFCACRHRKNGISPTESCVRAHDQNATFVPQTIVSDVGRQTQSNEQVARELIRLAGL